ncbi:IclR family transcriptional regulator [Cryobacterium frigoriphilum]|uniref:IclR family transcriptional regulator n=1 Tax=Cryobacterium frigoriphilum TaxID=1259150 RepID=A0A4R9A9N3_9MICO|nr:IclR family transcriptional regulator C-terminal domain-containing protein [Cryobacterium frigoriphilum]TFD54468.1 IclR family transcriptional regulator [Cryobacterium frigoriphilum]
MVTTDDQSGPERPDYFVRSAEMTLAVLLAFTANEPRQTVTQIADKTGVSRARARRFLLTLTDLGYLRSDGKSFELTPRTMDIGASYLANLSLPQVADEHLKRLAVELNETTSLCILDGPDVVYVARIAAPRLLGVSVNVGTRFPAWATSMGRVLLASLPEAVRESYFASLTLQAFTEHSVTSIDQLRVEVEHAAVHGWSLVSQELDDGLRGVAVPVRRGTQVIAAVNVSLQSHRVSAGSIEASVVPLLQKAALAIGDDFGGRRGGVRS